MSGGLSIQYMLEEFFNNAFETSVRTYTMLPHARLVQLAGALFRHENSSFTLFAPGTLKFELSLKYLLLLQTNISREILPHFRFWYFSIVNLVFLVKIKLFRFEYSVKTRLIADLR